MYDFFMAEYVHRPIGDRILQLTDRPVVVVEGARAVGKTTMIHQQLEVAGFGYVTLEDKATRQRAMADTAAWIRGLPTPIVIDEAQLLPDLPVELKRYVDALGPGCHFVITGSARIDLTGLGGANPLVRRADHVTMHPLTSWELSSQTGSVIDSLFDRRPRPGRYEQPSDEQLLDALRVGGFPGYAVRTTHLTRARLRASIAADLTGLLSSPVSPKLEFNAVKARALLEAVLRNPGGIFNAADLGNRLDLDKRTVERYVDIFGRLFLLQWLPNLATAPAKQGFARAKVHATDTSFSVDALERAGVDLLDKREFFGQILENYAVGQLWAQSQWSQLGPTMHYWRQPGQRPNEVDLVMVDETERTVAIEVKASTSVGTDDARGIRALAATRRLDRGFVLYRGEEVIELDSDIWALPFSALSDAAVFATAPPALRERDIVVRPSTAAASVGLQEDARLFLSYVHSDDEQEGGRIVQFAKDLVATYSLLYGHDLRLFIDREGIPWGQQWDAWLTREAGAATFLLSVVTPNYLRSETCRREVTEFSGKALLAGEPERLLLPLMWVDVTGTDVVAPGDPVLQRITASQYEDVTAVWQTDPGSVAYRAVVRRVAERLRQTIGSRAAGLPASDGADEPDLFELAAELESRQESIEEAVTAFRDAVGGISASLAEAPPVVARDPRSAEAGLIRLSRQLEPSRKDLETATAGLTAAWGDLDALMRKMAAMPLPDQIRGDMRGVLTWLDAALIIPGAEQLEGTLATLASASRHLRPFSRAVKNAMQVVGSLRTSVRAWSAIPRT